MKFEPDNVYHIYNMGNQSRTVFFCEENYLFFLRKIQQEIKPYCEIIAYCLMPNHFHLMIMTNKQSVELQSDGKMQTLVRKLGTLTSSYAQAVNKQQQLKGSLFRQKTKAKNLSQFITYPNSKQSYFLTCFIYIHQNPIASNLVKSLYEWQYSSFLDFAGKRNGTLCNTTLAFELLGFDSNTFHHLVSKPIKTDELKFVW